VAVVTRPGAGEHIGGPSVVTLKATGGGTVASRYLRDVVALELA
jgi:hypothetical protein